MKKTNDNILLEPNGYYLQVKEWHRRACPDNDSAAALLAFLLFFHRHKQSLKEYARLTNDMLRAKGKSPVADETDWQFHTDEMLQRKLFFWKNDTIRKATIYLEQDRGFIETNAPNYLKSLYKTGRTKWFRVIIPAVQQWISDNYPLIEAEIEQTMTMAPMARKYKKSDETLQMAKRLYRFRQLLLKEDESIPEKSQLNKITARLKAGKDEIDCAFAIIGNYESDWHRGINPNSVGDQLMTYHLIRHTFKDNEKVQFFTQIAENNGWTRTAVIAKYEELLNIEFENKTSLEIKESSLTETDKLEQARIYRETGSLLTELVITRKMKMDDILREFFDHSEQLKFSLIDLSDPDRLAQEIIDCLAQNEIVGSDRRDRIKLFAKNFINQLRGANV